VLPADEETMRSRNVRRSFTVQPAARPAFRTLHGWAIGVLLETHAIKECEQHGHRRDRTDPDAWRHAREIAAQEPFPGATPGEALQALDEVMQSIGDACPECQ
jgi:hypothetical protein